MTGYDDGDHFCGTYKHAIACRQDAAMLCANRS
jgi:hypothetical protein